MAALRRYAGLLSDKGVALGIVAGSDRDRVWERHIVDSLRAAACVPKGTRIADIGSGGGLPGIPLAIARSDLMVHLIEPRLRRVAFLELVVEALGLRNAAIVAARAQDAALSVEVCLARALAPAPEAWDLSELLLAPHGFLLYWAGKSWGSRDAAELAALGVSVELCAPASEVWGGSVLKMARTVHSEPTAP
jgi:16S rRNA (guanine527-N7)-methyltransferase